MRGGKTWPAARCMAQRTRYPGSMQARDASFFLGGLAEGNPAGRRSGPSTGTTSTSRENPNGAYASQALGRKMMLVQRLRGAGSARPIANEYLARFPDGPYASSANKLLHAQ